MAGSRRRRSQLRRQHDHAAVRHDFKPARRTANVVERLPQELLAKIHGHCTFLDRLAFAVVCKEAGHPMSNQVDTKTTAPWLVFPGQTDEKATFFSLADGRAASARTADFGARGHVVLGSSFGWLATADEQAGLHIVNPLTGDHAALPEVRTIPYIRYSLSNGVHLFVDMGRLQKIRYAGLAPPDDDNKSIIARSLGLIPEQMRQWFYRKVVLPASADRKSFAAMLILHKEFGVPAFATSEFPEWKVAPSRDGIEDAIHHDGRFYSVSCNGAIEAWKRDSVTGSEFTSNVVTPACVIPVVKGFHIDHKYIVAMPDRRLAVVLKYIKDQEPPIFRQPKKWGCMFKVQVLVDAARGGRWKETRDIGDAALFVGMSSSLCVSTSAAHLGNIKAGCIYFADDDLCLAGGNRERENIAHGVRRDGDKPQVVDPEHVGIYSLKHGTVDLVKGLGPQPWTSPPVWFTPSV